MTIGFMDRQQTRKQREFIRREQEILDAALILFAQKDWQAVTVEQIAKQAEIGKGTVYKHFSCKEEIYGAIALAHFNKFDEQWGDTPDGASIMDAIEHVLLQAFKITLEDPVGTKVTHYCKRAEIQRRLPKTIVETFDGIEKEHRCFFEELLVEGMKNGEIPEQSIDELVIALHTAYHGTLAMIWDGEILHYPELTPERFIQINSQFMLAGILGKRK
ncbi:MAG: TetR/AcrR family transcriptional regulator [Parashewanella sp.]